MSKFIDNGMLAMLATVVFAVISICAFDYSPNFFEVVILLNLLWLRFNHE